MPLFIAIQLLTALTLAMASPPIGSADLQRYVTADDPVYRWEHVAQTSLQEGLVVHELRLISQVWQGITWQYRLRIIFPQTPQDVPSLALLLVTGTGAAEQEWREVLFVARALRAPVALLSDIPNQPLFGGLVEDDLLAHTFVQFLTTQDVTWPLLLRMVKSVVRAMDAIQDVLRRRRPLPIAGFVVSGASKRGWTAWLTPAVDNRVKAIAPWSITISIWRGSCTISARPGEPSAARSPSIPSAVCRSASSLASQGRWPSPPSSTFSASATAWLSRTSSSSPPTTGISRLRP
jgi:PhoPQ-activated pathogenicity-related protein